jgi:hypothetical protein
MSIFRKTYPLMEQAGAGAGAGGGGGPAAGARAAAPAATPAASALAAAPAAAPAAPAPAPAWYDGFQNAEAKAWAQATGLPDAERAVEKAWNLEKLLGADRAGRTIVLPTDPADAKAWESIYTKLGRPETADGYKITAPEGSDPTFAKSASEWFHKRGLAPSQAQGLAEDWGKFVAEQQTAAAAAEQTALRAEHEALAAEWGTGPAADAQREMAKRAALKLGLDEAAITALEKVAGFSKTLKALAKVGQMTGETEAVGMGEGAQTFGMTPGAAKAQKARLMADKEWSKKYLNGDHQARAEMAKIDEVIASNR